jgi:hypothetical protein
MMQEVCETWSTTNASTPLEIVFYRHGLDGSHRQVIEEEMMAIRNAVHATVPNSVFTYIIVGKQLVHQPDLSTIKRLTSARSIYNQADGSINQALSHRYWLAIKLKRRSLIDRLDQIDAARRWRR